MTDPDLRQTASDRSPAGARSEPVLVRSRSENHSGFPDGPLLARVAALEPNEPVHPEAVDDLAVGVPPRPCL